jgi:FkbM family methyltransferase
MTTTPFAYQLDRPNGPRTVRLALDRSLMSQEIMAEYLEAGKLYEQETSAFFGAVLREGDSFLDIGAHVGWFSMLAAALVGTSGEVWSFEPDNRNHAQLLDHIALNQAAHVRPVHMAVGARAGVEAFEVNAENDGGHALRVAHTDAAREAELARPDRRPVYVTTLDSFFGDRTIPSLRAIKMDVEGAEHAVVEGARAFLARHQVPFVVAEMNDVCLRGAGSSEVRFRQLMTELGYDSNFFHPTRPELIKLEPGQTVKSEVLLNFCFTLPNSSFT